jgi:hypothetical protein
LELPPQMKLDMNSHYVNKSTTGIYGEVSVNLHTVPLSQVSKIAKPLNLANQTLNILPGERKTYTKNFTFDTEVNVFLLTSHTHKLAEKFVIKIYGGARNGEIVYSNTDWQHPPNKTFDTPIVLKPGEGLTSEITYFNSTAKTVKFGLTSEDEMGIIFGYIY